MLTQLCAERPRPAPSARAPDGGTDRARDGVDLENIVVWASLRAEAGLSARGADSAAIYVQIMARRRRGYAGLRCLRAGGLRPAVGRKSEAFLLAHHRSAACRSGCRDLAAILCRSVRQPCGHAQPARRLRTQALHACIARLRRDSDQHVKVSKKKTISFEQ